MDYTLGEKLYSRTYGNGLTVYVLPKMDFNKVFAMYSTHYGSIDNEFVVPVTGEHLKVPEGIAHFLEHKMFDMEYGNVFDKFAELGTSANAFTNYTNTTYLFSATSSYKENLKLLLEYVDTPYFLEESVEKEKGIIGQELRMYQDDPGWQVFLNLLTGMYHNHPVRIDIGGTLESIQLINADLLYKCYNTFYHPGNMVLFVTGCLGENEVFNLLDEYEANRDIGPQAAIQRIFQKEPEGINIPASKVHLDVAEPIFYIGFKDSDVGYDGYKLLKKEVLTDLILEVVIGRSSPLYEGLYDKGLVDDRFSFGFEGQRDYGYCTIGGETQDPEALYQELTAEITKCLKQKISSEDFERIKKRFQGDFIHGFNSPEFIASSFVSYHHKNVNVFDYLKVLDEITTEEAQERLENLLDFKRHATSIVMPK